MKQILTIVCLVALVGAAIGMRVGAQTSNVSTTVEIGAVSVTVAPTSFDYGSMPHSGIKTSFEVINYDIGGEIFINNIRATVGGVETDLTIKGANSTGGTGWTLSDSAVGADTYMHEAGLATNGTTTPATYGIALHNTSYKTLQSAVTALDAIYFGLNMNTPASGTVTQQQTAIVTVQAAWSGN